MRHLQFLLILILGVLFAGCSGSSSPTTPADSALTTDNYPIIGASLYESGGFNATGVLGSYELKIFPETQTAELTTSRMSAIGESYIVSGIGFFTISPCPDCLKIKSIELTSDNHLKLSFAISHPFQPGDPFKPPTAMNRLDLDIFDLAMVVKPMGEGSVMYSKTGVEVYPGYLSNSDGYTRELANLVGDSSALPYVLVIDDSSTEPPSSTWNKFAMGAIGEFETLWNLSDQSSIDFQLYLTMGYGASAIKITRLDPDYFNPEFNRKAAWKVVVTPPEGDNSPAVGNTWNSIDPTAAYNVRVEVYDWQIGATVYDNQSDFANAPHDNIYAASEPTTVTVEIPGMNNSLQSVMDHDGSGTGMPGSPLIYNVSIANENLIGGGEYYGLVKVTDSRPVLTSALTRDYLIDAPDGVELINYDIPEYATYQIFRATVLYSGCGPITGEMISGCPTEDISDGAILDFEVYATSDNGGSVVLYEVDTNYDGIMFNSVSSNSDGVFDGIGPFDVPSPCEDNIPYEYTVAFRATDDCIPPNVTVFAICELTINDCCPSDTGDLTVVSINRGERGLKEEQITSVSFDWNDHPCAVEYAFERADGYTGTGWTLVEVVYESEYDFIPEGLDLDDDIRFRVIARSESGGNPSTDFGPSHEVFILFMSDMGDLGGPPRENNWIVVKKEQSHGLDLRRWYWGVDEWGECGLGFYGDNQVGVVNTNTWVIGHTPYEVPNLAGSKEAYFDGYISPGANWTPQSLGFVIGTLSEPPTQGMECYDLKPATEILGSQYFAYNNPNCEGINEQFGETNQGAWRLTPDFGPPHVWRHVGYYLNDLLEPERKYIALGFANGNTPLTPGTS